MSEYFIQKYGPVADALLVTHGLRLPDETRDMTRGMLADTIGKYRELPQPEPKLRGSRSATPALRIARTHAKKLIEYAYHPPTRKTSMQIRRTKLAAALRSNEVRVGLDLVLAGIDPTALLVALDKGDVDTETLRRLVQVVNDVEKEPGGIGRPWGQRNYVVRGGCIAWERAGCRIGYQWNDVDSTLTGKLSAFLRDLVACCAGTHPFVKEKPRRVPIGCTDSFPVPKGNALRGRAGDRMLRDDILAWRAWRKAHPAKNGTFSS